jgi:7,8-dihydropterin-6-yl-methyl-4-(beta-D-ribofuranosyl)aminobenzene 5'-phosphate synthase
MTCEAREGCGRICGCELLTWHEFRGKLFCGWCQAQLVLPIEQVVGNKSLKLAAVPPHCAHAFYRKDLSLTPEQRYYNGAPPEKMRFGSAWPDANFELVDKDTEISPDIHLIALVSDKPGTLELRELSLAINTPEGMVIVVGCSHPGIDRIVAAAASISPHIHVIVGGFHLVVTSDADIEKVVAALHDTYKVEYVAPGHCTGEPAFTAFRKGFGDHYLYAGLGTTLELIPRSQK